MKALFVILTVCMVSVSALFFLSARQHEAYSEFSDGGHISLKGGKGTANVWGLRFFVEEVKGSGTSTHSETTTEIETGETVESNTFNIGDVDIRLVKGKAELISVWINGKSIGKVGSGAKITIDGSRSVSVDGLSR